MGKETTKPVAVALPHILGMEEVQYKAIYDYISVQQYPLGYTKSEKYVLCCCSKSYEVQGDKLVYKDRQADGSTLSRMVICSIESVHGVPSHCWWHRGRDATIGKIKECYYWPNYYKEVEEKLGVIAVATELGVIELAFLVSSFQ